MKKYLMYLGILLALFSTPQVANAAVEWVNFHTSLTESSNSTMKDLSMTSINDEKFYWAGSNVKNGRNFTIKRGGSDWSEEQKFRDCTISPSVPMIENSTTGSYDGWITGLTDGQSAIFVYDGQSSKLFYITQIDLKSGNGSNDWGKDVS